MLGTTAHPSTRSGNHNRLWRVRVQIAAGDIWNPWCAFDPEVGFSILRPDAPTVVLLTPSLYTERLIGASHFIEKVAVAPLAGCAGIGEMRHVLAGVVTTGQIAA